MPSFNSLGSALAALRNRLDDAMWERHLNIRTSGRMDVDRPDSVPYSTFAYHSINRVLDRLELQPGDVLVDIGCGMGRVTCAAALRPMQRVIGIDVDAALCQQARENTERMRGGVTPIEIIQVPAEEFDYTAAAALFMFNPFNYATLRKVLAAVTRSGRGDEGSLRLAYVNPRCESVLAESGAFERYDHWPLARGSRLKFAVSYWRLKRGHSPRGLVEDRSLHSLRADPADQ